MDGAGPLLRAFRFLMMSCPVRFGQSRSGLVTAAVLIACWQLGRAALAEEPNPGFSENDYFRLEWEYDLAGGAGMIRMVLDGDPGPADVLLQHFEFTTREVLFDSLTIDGQPAPLAAHQLYDGRYEYSLTGPLEFTDVLEIDLTYPAVDVDLYGSMLEYSGTVSSGYGMVPFPGADMNLVTIQAIPEAPTGALLGAAVAAVTGFLKRGIHPVRKDAAPAVTK